jgi:DNA-binding LacI/PurR family transcriptional regulator
LQGTNLGAHSMSVDQAGGARLAARHLLDLGHAAIVHLSGPLDWIDAQARRDGFLDELARAGVEPRSLAAGDWTAQSGYRAGIELLDARDFTAVFASNDQMALGFLHACHERGVDVPADVSLVGFDDIPEAAHFTPPLTTVRQNFEELGHRAVSILLAELRGDPPLQRSPVVPELRVRASTASARA